jgi:hypothetical protein
MWYVGGMATSAAARRAYWRDRRKQADWSLDAQRDVKIAVLAAPLALWLAWGKNIWENVWIPTLSIIGAVLLFECIRYVWRFVVTGPREAHFESLKTIARLEKERDTASEAEGARNATQEAIADGERYMREWKARMFAPPTRVEHIHRVAREQQRPTGPKAIVRCECSSETAILHVTNDGDLGTFYATIRVHGLVIGLSGDEFVRWSHSNAVKITIPRGVTFRADLAQLEWNGAMARWRLFGATEHGRVDASASYASCATSSPIAKAADLVVSGEVIAEPDLPSGPVPYRIVLSAFGCESQDDSTTPPASQPQGP